MKVSEFRNLIREEVRNVLKEEEDTNIVQDLSTAKSGQFVWRLMKRNNPQLGTYYVFELVKITRVSASSISCDDNAVYDKKSGNRKSKSTSAYGSSYYTIMDEKTAEEEFSELQSAGEKVRGFNK